MNEREAFLPITKEGCVILFKRKQAENIHEEPGFRFMISCGSGMAWHGTQASTTLI